MKQGDESEASALTHKLYFENKHVLNFDTRHQNQYKVDQITCSLRSSTANQIPSKSLLFKWYLQKNGNNCCFRLLMPVDIVLERHDDTRQNGSGSKDKERRWDPCSKESLRRSFRHRAQSTGSRHWQFLDPTRMNCPRLGVPRRGWVNKLSS